jgi:hypothetical protein
MAQSTLADRLHAVTSQRNSVEFMKMSYEQLANQRISFGEAKLGQKFQDVIQQDPKYATWFIKKYETSQKPAHQAFVHFIGLYVERQEMQLEAEPLAQPSKYELKAKAKAQPMRVHYPETPDNASQASWSEEDVSKPWSVIQEETSQRIQEEVTHQNGRIENMENALQQITHQLQALTHAMLNQGNVPKS